MSALNQVHQYFDGRPDKGHLPQKVNQELKALTTANVFSDSLNLDVPQVEIFFSELDHRDDEYSLPANREEESLYDPMDDASIVNRQRFRFDAVHRARIVSPRLSSGPKNLLKSFRRG